MNGDGESRDPEVTEVSAEVLEELSRLFGPDGVEDSGRDGTETQVVEDPSSVSGPTVTVVVEFVDEGTDNAGSVPGDEPGTEAPSGPVTGGRVIDFRRPVDDGPAPLGDPLVVIDMDEDPVVHSPTDVDPRFAERQRAWARRDRLSRVRWLKIAGVLVALGVASAVVLASPLFAIRTFTVEGNVYTSSRTVEKVRRILKGTSVFTADTSRARSVLLSDPWVADVRISTHFPSSVVVEISERTPVVWYVGADNKARMVDARGHVIDVLTGFPTKYLQVKGTGPSVDPGSIADDAYRAAAQLVLALPDELRPKVTALDLSPAGELSMVLKGDTLVRFGRPTDLQNKLVAVVVLLRRQDPATIAVVDVSAGDPTVLPR